MTLIEVLVTVALTGILAALAVPSFVDTIDRYRMRTVAEEMTASLSLARVEAIKRGGNLLLRKTAGSTCPTNQEWSCGWEIVAPGGVLVQRFSMPANYNLLNMTSGNDASLTLNRWGQVNGINALHFRVTRGSKVLSVCVASGGRIRTLEQLDC